MIVCYSGTYIRGLSRNSAADNGSHPSIGNRSNGSSRDFVATLDLELEVPEYMSRLKSIVTSGATLWATVGCVSWKLYLLIDREIVMKFYNR